MSYLRAVLGAMLAVVISSAFASIAWAQATDAAPVAAAAAATAEPATVPPRALPDEPSSASASPAIPSEGAPVAPRASRPPDGSVRGPPAARTPAAVATGLGSGSRLQPQTASEAVRIALVLTVAALIPALVICMTPFIRIIVVLSMIRHAFGMPETPPNQVLISLAIFLTAFIMLPTITVVNDRALQPFLSGTATLGEAAQEGEQPLKAFMLRQVSDRDLKTVYDIADQPLPETATDVGLLQLTSAFMLNELRVAFKIGFVVLLPFLLIDIVVSSLLLSLGMLMVPPSTISLPLKVLMFVLVDGWGLILTGVVDSFR